MKNERNAALSVPSGGDVAARQESLAVLPHRVRATGLMSDTGISRCPAQRDSPAKRRRLGC